MTSASQTRFGVAAVKSRAIRFGAIGRPWRLSVVRTRRGDAMIAPMPCRRISSSIRPRPVPPILRLQGGVNPRTAIVLAAVVMDLPDLGQQHSIGACTGAHVARAKRNSRPARPRAGAHQLHRMAVAVAGSRKDRDRIPKKQSDWFRREWPATRSQRFGAALQICYYAGAVLLLIWSAPVPVAHAVAQGVIEQAAILRAVGVIAF